MIHRCAQKTPRDQNIDTLAQTIFPHFSELLYPAESLKALPAPPDIRCDIVFFVNGVRVIIVETKRATALEGSRARQLPSTRTDTLQLLAPVTQ